VGLLADVGQNYRRCGRSQAFRETNLLAPSNPAAKGPTNCYLIARMVNGRFTRSDDTPVNGPNHGYRCDQPYLNANGTTTG
jgi:hypothetical protein